MGTAIELIETAAQHGRSYRSIEKEYSTVEACAVRACDSSRRFVIVCHNNVRT